MLLIAISCNGAPPSPVGSGPARCNSPAATNALQRHIEIGGGDRVYSGRSHQNRPFLQILEKLSPSDRDLLFQFYGGFRNQQELLTKYHDLMEGIASLKFVAGFCYTQLTDIEQETNGLLTYDRKPKLDPALVTEIHENLFTNKPQEIVGQRS